MTIYGIPDGSSDDQWVQPMNPNRENMKDDQMEIGKLLNSNENADYQKHEQMDHNTYIFRDTVEEVNLISEVINLTILLLTALNTSWLRSQFEIFIFVCLIVVTSTRNGL